MFRHICPTFGNRRTVPAICGADLTASDFLGDDIAQSALELTSRFLTLRRFRGRKTMTEGPPQDGGGRAALPILRQV
jgi:hypothetical protein